MHGHFITKRSIFWWLLGPFFVYFLEGFGPSFGLYFVNFWSIFWVAALNLMSRRWLEGPMAHMSGPKAHRSGPKAHRGGPKAQQTSPEGLEFERHVAPSNSSWQNGKMICENEKFRNVKMRKYESDKMGKCKKVE